MCVYQFSNRVDILVILKENHLGAGVWVAVVRSEVICSKGKQSEHEGRGMHITSTHPIRTGCAFFDVSLCYFGAPSVGTPLISLFDYDEGNKKTSYLLFSLSC